MGWQLTDDRARFLDEAGESLVREPVRNTALLSVTGTDRPSGPGPVGDPLLFAWWTAAPGAAAVVRRGEIRVSALPEDAAQSLAPALLDAGCPVGAVQGPVEAADTVASAWAARTGGLTSVVLEQRLYDIDVLVPPAPRPGEHARTADAGDRPLMLDWFTEFYRDAGLSDDPAPVTDDLLAYAGAVLWIADGTPVSMAARTRTEGGVARVFGVYTPRPLRGCGHGSAVAAAVTRAITDAGHQPVLFTDLANPTSNKIYQRLGYTPAGNYVLRRLTAP